MKPSSNSATLSTAWALGLFAAGVAVSLATPVQAGWRHMVEDDRWGDEVVIIEPPAPVPYGSVLVAPDEPPYDAPYVDEALIAPPDEGADMLEAPPGRVPVRGEEALDGYGDPYPEEGLDNASQDPSVVPSLVPKRTVRPQRAAVEARLTLPVPRPNIEAIDAADPLVRVVPAEKTADAPVDPVAPVAAVADAAPIAPVAPAPKAEAVSTPATAVRIIPIDRPAATPARILPVPFER